jgi:hypothetical protein
VRGLFGSNWTIKTEYLSIDLGCGDRTLPNLGLTFSTKLKQYIFRKQFERRF